MVLRYILVGYPCLMHDISNNRASSKISELFVRSNMIHSHYTRFSAAGHFRVQRSRLNQLLLSFSRSGIRIWHKTPLTLREQRKDPFKSKLHKLLSKVLETKNGVCWYEYHYQFLPKLLIQLKCFSSLYLWLLPFIYFILFCFLFTHRSFADFIGDNYCIVAHL